MTGKWIGAALVIGCCGLFGFSAASAHRREERELRELLSALDYMQCELQYRLTPLPELCRQAGHLTRGCCAGIFKRLAEELELKLNPDADGCIALCLRENGDLPGKSYEAFRLLGNSLGRFDVDGQVQELEAVRAFCRRELEGLSQNREQRLRSYQTLGLCAGAALAILFV